MVKVQAAALEEDAEKEEDERARGEKRRRFSRTKPEVDMFMDS